MTEYGGIERRNITAFEQSLLQRISSIDATLAAIKVQIEGNEKAEAAFHFNYSLLLEQKFEPILKALGDHHKTLYGDGSEGSPGLEKEVDRFKVRSGIAMWGFIALAGTWVADFGHKVFDKFFK